MSLYFDWIYVLIGSTLGLIEFWFGTIWIRLDLVLVGFGLELNLNGFDWDLIGYGLDLI